MVQLKATMSILGGFIINLTLGSFYSIGNLVPYIVSFMKNNGNRQVTNEYGPWLTASFLFGQGIFILIGAKIEKISNTRIAALFGCIIHSCTTMATSWAVTYNYTAVVALYGFGTGAGCGSAYIANIINAQGYYPQRKGFVTGIMVGGFGLGGLLFSPLQTLYMNPQNLLANSTGNFPEAVYSKLPHLFIYMGLLFLAMQAIGLLLAEPSPKQIIEPSVRISNIKTVIIADEEVLPSIDSYSAAFQYRSLYVVGLMMMLVAPGVTFVNTLGKAYGLVYIRDDKYLTGILGMASVANALGRVSWGWLMERIGFRNCYTIKILLFACLISTFPFAFVLNSRLFYAFWMLGLFVGFCATFVLFPVYIEQLFGAKYHGMIYGTLYIFMAISSGLTSAALQLFVGPALAAKSDKPEDSLIIRMATCLCIALLFLLSLALYCILLPTRKLDSAIRRRFDVELEKTRNSLANRQDLIPRRNLAAKTHETDSTLASQKETSLGSIVRFTDSPKIFGQYS